MNPTNAANAAKIAKEKIGFKVAAIPAEIAEKVRTAGQWAGFPASTSVATGYGPCRLCLNTFETGRDERTLFTYNAFHGRAELPLPGPVFIHKEGCKRYEGSEFPAALRDLPMFFEGFGKNGVMLWRAGVDKDSIEARIEEMLSMPLIEYIYVRNAEAGCFMAFIDRA